MTQRHGVWVELSKGNIDNDHFYLSQAIDMFPPDCIGGPNKETASSSLISVAFAPGQTITTDIDGSKKFFRSRSTVRDFFERSGAQPGDFILIRKTGERSFEITLARTTP